MKGSRAWWLLLRALTLGLALGLMTLVGRASDEAGGAIAVVYPDIDEPYRSVFAAMIEGVQSRSRGRVSSHAVGPSSNGADLSQELRRRDVRAVIALGRNGLKVAPLMGNSIGVVVGGVLSLPEAEAQQYAVVTLAPDPALLFARLRALMPQARRVMVVYDPRQNTWLIRLAREAARGLGLELVALEADDLKSAIRHYQTILNNTEDRRDVLWLPQDSTTVEDSAVLPLVLRESWNHNLPVFSSSLAHVKRGALFSLYPDNVALGRTLASLAQGYASTGAHGTRGLMPLRDVLMAVNTRTAKHLGVDLGASQQRFHMVFPEP